MYYYQKRKLFSFGPYLLGWLFVAVGTVTCLSPWFVQDDNTTWKALVLGGAFLAFGILILLTFSGVLFDFEKMRFKPFYSIAGIKIGHWQSLESVAFVKVFFSSFTGASLSNGINPSTPFQVQEYLVVLYSSSRPVATLHYDKKEQAHQAAKHISETLAIPLDMQL